MAGEVPSKIAIWGGLPPGRSDGARCEDENYPSFMVACRGIRISGKQGESENRGVNRRR